MQVIIYSFTILLLTVIRVAKASDLSKITGGGNEDGRTSSCKRGDQRCYGRRPQYIQKEGKESITSHSSKARAKTISSTLKASSPQGPNEQTRKAANEQ